MLITKVFLVLCCLVIIGNLQCMCGKIKAKHEKHEKLKGKSLVNYHAEKKQLIRPPGKPGNHGNRNKRQTECEVLPNSTLTQAEKDEFLRIHNEQRKIPIPAGPVGADHIELEWSDHLADLAMKVAKTCVLEHAMLDSCPLGRVGQNLYTSTGLGVSESTVMEAFYSEYIYYNLTNGKCAEGNVCGHYEQIVWAETKQVGCAKFICDSLVYVDGTVVFPGKQSVYVACDYYPPGNWAGEKPYKEGDACSMCDSPLNNNMYQCNNGLCAKCSSTESEGCVCAINECENGGIFSSSTCDCTCTTGTCGSLCEVIDIDPTPNCEYWETFGYCSDSILNIHGPYMQQNCGYTCAYCA